MGVLYSFSFLVSQIHIKYSRLEGGAADEEGTSSSGSRDRLRPVRPDIPRFAADMLGRSGELQTVRSVWFGGWTSLPRIMDLPHLGGVQI